MNTLPVLEDEMCDFGPNDLFFGRSPDRLDALVWAVTALAGRASGGPRVTILGADPRMPVWLFGRK